MHTFLIFRAKEPSNLAPEFFSRCEATVPVMYERKIYFVSPDKRTHVLFFELNTRLYMENSCIFHDDSGVTLFSGHLWPVYDEKNLYNEMAHYVHNFLRQNSYDEFQANFNGEYALVNIDCESNQIRAFTDPIGARPLYYSESKEGIWISNRIYSIISTAQFTSADFSPNDYDLNVLAYHATRGYLPPGKTIYRNIHECPPGGMITVDSNELVLRSNPLPYHQMAGTHDCAIDNQIWNDVMAEICSNFRFLKHRNDIYPQLGLSGGKDSRVMLAAALHENVANKILFITRGLPIHPDVIVAKEITAHFNLPHVLVPSAAGNPESMIRIFEKDMPVHMWYSEGMLNLFDLQSRTTCGDDPMFNGLNGENLRSVYDLLDHAGVGTEMVTDGRTAIEFLERRAPFDIADIVHKHMTEGHRKERINWVEAQIRGGVPAEDIPSLYRTMYQSVRRNCNISKVRGYWYHYIDVLTGNKLFWLAFNIGGAERRNERIHFELIKRSSEWLADHHFAYQSWHSNLFRKGNPPRGVVPKNSDEVKVIRNTDWRVRINTDREYRNKIQDYVLSNDSNSVFWDIVDRNRLVKYLERSNHSHMSRFHFYGALTIDMVLRNNSICEKMERVDRNKAVFVKEKDKRGIYIACQGKVTRVVDMAEFRRLGGAEKDIWIVTPATFRRFVKMS